MNKKVESETVRMESGPSFYLRAEFENICARVCLHGFDATRRIRLEIKERFYCEHSLQSKWKLAPDAALNASLKEIVYSAFKTMRPNE